ncbi:unnamed protein product, partial [Tetraodon nigroviridis]
CNECDSKFAEEEALKQHMLQVHSDKPYKCDRCQAAFRYKGNLASHKTVHTGEKPYRCNICGAQFNRPANLKTHTRIHSGEKPYKCETCGARFVQVTTRPKTILSLNLFCLASAGAVDFSFLVITFFSSIGCSSPCPCANPHGREAISMRDLWNALPTPADTEEPPAYPHRREALPCESPVRRFCQVPKMGPHFLNNLISFLSFFSSDQCEKCNLHFRHKSQLRLHLRQKHGAITNTKIQYRMSTVDMPTDLTKTC